MSALEAWVHSHPLVSPCDVYPDMFLWGWTYLPTLEENEMWTPQLKAAPRFPLQQFWEPAILHHHYATNQLDHANWFGTHAKLAMWDFLYNMGPPENSFVVFDLEGRVTPTGFWTLTGYKFEAAHVYDVALSKAVLDLAKSLSVTKSYDFGCGQGKYVEAFREAGIETTGLDGNPLTSSIPNCRVQDLTADFDLEPVSFLLSRESNPTHPSPEPATC